MTSWLVPLEAIARKRGSDGASTLGDLRAIGGKAARLAWLVRHGLPCPTPGCSPPTRSPRRFASSRRGASRARSCARQRARRVYARGRGAAGDPRAPSSPAGSPRSCADLWREVAHAAPWGLAVRSSATCEDGALVSMAGLAESDARRPRRRRRSPTPCARCGRRSRRGARSRTSPRTACATSAWRSSSSAWSRREAAGVMFTRAAATRRLAAPTSGSSTCGFGLGSPVVDGVTTPDVLRIDARGRLRRVGHRAQGAGDRRRPGRARGGRRRGARPPGARRRERIAAARRDRRAPREARAGRVGRRVRVRRRQDRGSSRRGPRRGEASPEGGDAETVWSSVNVGEALPGRRHAVHVVGRRRVQRGGVPPRVRRARVPRPEARAPRRQRLRALLPEPHAVHAHRRAGARSSTRARSSSSAAAAGATSWRRRWGTSAGAASTRASR